MTPRSAYRVRRLMQLLALGGSLALPASVSAQAPTSGSIPTLDQSLEMRSVSSPRTSPDGRRVVYEVQRTNWDENAFERDISDC